MAHKEAFRIKVGWRFLRAGCDGRPSLAPSVSGSCPGEEFTFGLRSSRVVGQDDADGVPGSGGLPDLLTVVEVRAERCGRLYHLSARQDRLYPTRLHVVLVADKAGDWGEGGQEDEEERRWVLTPVPGSRFLLRPWNYRDFCLANDKGQLCLRRVSGVPPRSRCVVFHPITHHCHRNRHRRQRRPARLSWDDRYSSDSSEDSETSSVSSCGFSRL